MFRALIIFAVLVFAVPAYAQIDVSQVNGLPAKCKRCRIKLTPRTPH
jgi:hypothetical protein